MRDNTGELHMSQNAAKKVCEVVDITHWKHQYLLSLRRTDSERLINCGKETAKQIPQKPVVIHGSLETRVFRRCVAILKFAHHGNYNTAESVALHISKAFTKLLNNPEQFYGFFDIIGYKMIMGANIMEVLHVANGCLLTATFYHMPPWEVYKPNRCESYARSSGRLYGMLCQSRYKIPKAVDLLSDDRHIKKAVDAIADLFLHPSKI